jgi:uncharacterized delta-60 repeat protein
VRPSCYRPAAGSSRPVGARPPRAWTSRSPRHDTAGNLDRSFGTDGIATTDLGGADDEAYDAALLPDGGIVVVGRTDAAGVQKTDLGIVRYGPDGAPDAGFGSGGIVKKDFFGGGDQAKRRRRPA